LDGTSPPRSPLTRRRRRLHECVVSQATVHASAQTIRFEIAANRFLHNMVRRLAGALVEVGRGRLAVGDIATILATRDIQRGGPCLPAAGLCLMEVTYPPDPQFDAGAVVDAPPSAL
jgi:tRNA pseudouridine38-40 synthase